MSYTSAASQLTALKYDAGFDAPEIAQYGGTLYMSGEQYRYRDPREAVDRANRILANNLPAGVKTLSVTQTRDRMPMVTKQTDVAGLHRKLEGYPLGQEAEPEQTRVEPVDTRLFGRGYRIKPERFSYSFSPTLAQSLGGPEDFLSLPGRADEQRPFLADGPRSAGRWHFYQPLQQLRQI